MWLCWIQIERELGSAGLHPEVGHAGGGQDKGSGGYTDPLAFVLEVGHGDELVQSPASSLPPAGLPAVCGCPMQLGGIQRGTP